MISRYRPWARRWAMAWFGGLLVVLSAKLSGESHALTTEQLRIVGGLGSLHQFTRYEEPFWVKELPRLSGGRAKAVIVPFDQAGLRGNELLRLLKVGSIPFATVLLALVSAEDPELGTADLAGLNPDMKTLRSHLAAFRPHLEQRLREHWGVEPLAIYVYPAQVIFCDKPFTSLADLPGRRIRSSNTGQSDLIEALGAIPVRSSFNEILPKLRKGDIECAITGTMSGNTIGLDKLTTHIHTLAANWGLAVFAANLESWNALSPELRSLLRRELLGLEQAIWRDAETETGEGLLCNSGADGCVNGRKGRMTLVQDAPADGKRWREIFESTVLPRWVQRCGKRCAAVWNQTLGPSTGIEADAAVR